jgi:hypothetical protein
VIAITFLNLGEENNAFVERPIHYVKALARSWTIAYINFLEYVKWQLQQH